MKYDDIKAMSYEEIKDLAKDLGIATNKVSKEKLIEKVIEAQAQKDTINSVIGDDEEMAEIRESKSKITESKKENTKASVIDKISSIIDDLDDSADDTIEVQVDLPINTIVNVKSITFGGLTYKSRTTNAVFRWNQIGSIQSMTVEEITEMSNYKSDFLRKPLVVLMDERAVAKFRLTPVYEKVAKINNLTEIFNSSISDISNWLDDVLAVDMRDVLISKVRQMYKNHRLVDINIIRLLEQKLCFDLTTED